jgi:hypothetical protein
MFKVKLLIISSFAAGFGLCSIIFALFTIINQVNFANIFRLVLATVFFLANLVFVIQYYRLLIKELYYKKTSKFPQN